MQMHPAFIEALMKTREEELQQRALHAANRRSRRAAAPVDRSDRERDTIVIRPARPADASALARVAELDGSSRHGDRLAALARSSAGGAVLVAEANGSIVAALDVSEQLVVADPFRRSTAARELLKLRSHQLGAQPRRRLRLGVPRPRLRPRAA